MPRYRVYDIQATYGSSRTPCTCYVYETSTGWWYVIHGSVSVNFTPEEPTEGCDLEALPDVDMFTAGEPITSEGALEEALAE